MVCTVPGCRGVVVARNYCQMHYRRVMRTGDPNVVRKGGPAPQTLHEVIDTMLDRALRINGCTLAAGSRDDEGYVPVRLEGKYIGNAHRVLWEFVAGMSVPDGMTLDHLCHTRSECTAGRNCAHRSCIRFDHLELVTFTENVKRAHRPLKSECINGHALTPENTYRYGQAGQRCRTCNADAQRRRAARRSEVGR